MVVLSLSMRRYTPDLSDRPHTAGEAVGWWSTKVVEEDRKGVERDPVIEFGSED
jgi:hypothetical protein